MFMMIRRNSLNCAADFMGLVKKEFPGQLRVERFVDGSHTIRDSRATAARAGDRVLAGPSVSWPLS